MCIQTGYIFLQIQEGRADSGSCDRRDNTRSIHQGQSRVVCWRDSIQTLTIRLGRGVGVACFIFGLDICTRGGCRAVNHVSCTHSKQLEPHIGGGVVRNIRYPLLPVPGAWLSVALAVRGAVAGVRVSSSWWRGDGVARGRGVSRAGLVP